VLDPRSVVGAIEAAWPGGGALLPFTAHPDARVRRAAISPAASAGHPDLVPRLAQLANDPDPDVAAASTAAARRLQATPPALQFTLLGGFGLRRGSWQVEDTAWDRRVAQRLVRYLLVHRGRAVPDDLLLEAFWSDTPTDRARRSLQVAVSCARAVLDLPDIPSVIEAAERTLRMSLRKRDSVDVDRFEQAARVALTASDGDRRQLLEHTAALWTGEPLPEERYADWTIPWRDALEVRYAEVLSALVRSCHAEEDHVAATQAARRLVELDPLNEAAQRDLMICYARSGRRAHALRQYLECRRLLIDELGIEPAREITELQQRILAGEPV
jgi:DNA-binding SARP family transcriptional activator